MSAPPSERERSLGLAWLILSGMSAALGLVFGAVWIGIAVLAGTLPDSTTGEPLDPWMAFAIGAFGALAAVVILAVSGAGVMAGWGLRKGSPWARPLAMVLAFMSLLNFPIGTLLGGLTLVTLTDRER